MAKMIHISFYLILQFKSNERKYFEVLFIFVLTNHILNLLFHLNQIFGTNGALLGNLVCI